MLIYFSKYYNFIFTLFLQHILLVSMSLGFAVIFALPVGFLLSKSNKCFSAPILALLGVIYTIPSLAFFALIIPVAGLGVKPAVIALVAYSQFILVRNIMVGFQSINLSIIQAGKGMGLGWLQMLWKIELPLALPVIIGGIRIATISIIGIATIAAWINAGGLGVILFEGLYQNSAPKIFWGTCFVSVLAITTNQLLLWVEKYARLKAQGEI